MRGRRFLSILRSSLLASAGSSWCPTAFEARAAAASTERTRRGVTSVTVCESRREVLTLTNSRMELVFGWMLAIEVEFIHSYDVGPRADILSLDIPRFLVKLNVLHSSLKV